MCFEPLVLNCYLLTRETPRLWPLMNTLRTRQAAISISTMQSGAARKLSFLSTDSSGSSESLVSQRRFVNTGDGNDVDKQLSAWCDKVNVAVLTPEELEIHTVHLTAVKVTELEHFDIFRCHCLALLAMIIGVWCIR